MKVLATRDVAASGQHLAAGKVHDVSESDAALLIRQGKAVEAPPESCPPIKPTPKKAKVSAPE